MKSSYLLMMGREEMRVAEAREGMLFLMWEEDQVCSSSFCRPSLRAMGVLISWGRKGRKVGQEESNLEDFESFNSVEGGGREVEI